MLTAALIVLVYLVGCIVMRTCLYCADVLQGYCDDSMKFIAIAMWPVASIVWILITILTFILDRVIVGTSDYLISVFCRGNVVARIVKNIKARKKQKISLDK